MEQVGESVRARKLFRRGESILVAVSGGVDSMVLLHLLHALAPKHGWRLAVAHFNHQLRGRSSDADERLVRQTAREFGLPFSGGQGNVRAFARAKKISIEMAARELRHAFLARTAQRLRIPLVALAHHADDQVELFFLRLLRGSGGEGLAGMKWLGSSPANPKIKLARPLLGVNKAALERFARENKIQFREDMSNASPDFQRNRIRRELLPLLRENYSPALDRTILRVMEIVGAEAEFVDEAARTVGKNFSKLPVALQRRVLQRQLLALAVELDFDLVEKLRREPGLTVSVALNLVVSRAESGKVQLHKPKPARFHRGRAVLDVRGKGSIKFDGLNFSWSVGRQKVFRRPKPVAGREFFDADKVGRRIVLRHWRAGDRFQPIGMKSAVKLQDLFVNAKIPHARRRELAMAMTAGGEIFWVEGLRIGERFKLTLRTERKFCWRWRKAG